MSWPDVFGPRLPAGCFQAVGIWVTVSPARYLIAMNHNVDLGRAISSPTYAAAEILLLRIQNTIGGTAQASSSEIIDDALQTTWSVPEKAR